MCRSAVRIHLWPQMPKLLSRQYMQSAIAMTETKPCCNVDTYKILESQSTVQQTRNKYYLKTVNVVTHRPKIGQVQQSQAQDRPNQTHINPRLARFETYRFNIDKVHVFWTHAQTSSTLAVLAEGRMFEPKVPIGHDCSMAQVDFDSFVDGM